MAYRLGMNRIFYRPSGFRDTTVTCYIYSPLLVKSELHTLTRLEEGIYYIDLTFDRFGDYLGVFFENGVKTATAVFKVDTKMTLFYDGQPLF